MNDHACWDDEILDFLHNASFSLYFDIFNHCLEIFALEIAERIGGPEGYKLLLSAVKSSLQFRFVNTASAEWPTVQR